MTFLKIQYFNFLFRRQIKTNEFYSNLKNSLFSIATLLFLLAPLSLNASDVPFCWKAFPTTTGGQCHDDKTEAINDFMSKGLPYSLMNEQVSIDLADDNRRYNYKMPIEPLEIGPWLYRVENAPVTPLPTYDNEEDAFNALESQLMDEALSAGHPCEPYSEVWLYSDWVDSNSSNGHGTTGRKTYSHLFYRGDYYPVPWLYQPCTAFGPGTRHITRLRTVQCPQGTLQMYDPEIGMCVNNSQARVMQYGKFSLGVPLNSCPKEGNPCSPATGAKTQTETDYALANGTLKVQRTYNSQGLEDGYINMGPRWRHNYTQRLNGYKQPMDEESVKTHPYPATNRTSYYDTRYKACTLGWQEIKSSLYGGLLENGTPYYRSGMCEIRHGSNYVLKLPIINSLNHTLDAGSYTKVSYVSRGNGQTEVFRYQYYQWRPLYPGITSIAEIENGWSVTLNDNTVENYDESGRLVISTNQKGQNTHFIYDGEGRLQTVTGHHGETLTYTYDQAGFLTTITTPDGDLVYDYDAEGRLVSVTYPDNRTRQYHYEDLDYPYHLTGITDENNDRYATWTYDDEGRAILSEHANSAERVEFAYNSDGSTTVTDAAGAERVYHFTVQQGQMKVDHIEGDRCTTCSGGDIQAYTYDNNGFIASKTDWNGNTTTYTRDDQGRELSRTEASGTPQARTIITTWDVTLNKPLTVTGPEQITEFSYDAAGHLVSQQQRAVQ
ncbi:MAG: DUF6531 domain-containing protein [Candidatus Thiodiazotropha lotti]|nr:DUF6531 domain-containing protein [Candidatus Thiodiazotropha lotti]